MNFQEAKGAAPMLCFIYVPLIIVALYYASHQSCPWMAATANVLRQIWSGGCQSCRDSEVSGLSGLEPSPSSASERAPKSARETCVCDVCPCAGIQVVVRTASPVVNIFDDAMTLLIHVYLYILTSFIDSYEMFSRVLECRAACRETAQMLEQSNCDSLRKFSFGIKKSSSISRETNSSLREQDLNWSTTSSRQQGSFKVKDEPALRLFDTEPAAENMTSSVAGGEIEPTIEDKASFGTEEKGVGTRPDAESLPSSSREGTSHFSNRQRMSKGFVEGSNENNNSDASCKRCKEEGKLCLKHCPKNLSPKK